MRHILNIFILACLLLHGSAGFCIKIPKPWGWVQGNPEYKVINDYFDEYTSTLHEVFQPQKKFSKNSALGIKYSFILHRDGTISNMYFENNDKDFGLTLERFINLTQKDLDGRLRMSVSSYKRYFKTFIYNHWSETKEFDKYTYDLIMKNPPPPFPKDFEADALTLNISLNYKSNKHNEWMYNWYGNTITPMEGVNYNKYPHFVLEDGNIMFPPKFSILISKDSRTLYSKIVPPIIRHKIFADIILNKIK